MAAYTLACGGVGLDATAQGQSVIAVAISSSGTPDITRVRPDAGTNSLPFMVGTSIIKADDCSLFVVGGGATCFSMGTYWETGIYRLAILDKSRSAPENSQNKVQFLGSPRVTHSSAMLTRDMGAPGRHITLTSVTRVQVKSTEQFAAILNAGVPVIMEQLDIGDCVRKWNPLYLTDKIGSETEVSDQYIP